MLLQLWQICIDNRGDILVTILSMGMIYLYFAWVRFLRCIMIQYKADNNDHVDHRNEMLYRTKSHYKINPYHDCEKK